MRTVGAFEAKTHLSELLDDVARGERIAITKHGVPVAFLIPARTEHQDASGIIAAIRRVRRGVRLKGLKVRDLIDEGRRW